MSDTMIVCCHCGSTNRLPDARSPLDAKCGRCSRKLFAASPENVYGTIFERHVARTTLPLLVDVWAPWCGPCRAMAPILDRAAQEIEPQARFVKINVDDNPELSGRLGVQGIPALFVLKHGAVLARHSGLTSLATLRNWVRQFSN